MAEDDNNVIVTYTVKIKVTLTVPDLDEPIPDHDHRETQSPFNVGAETVPSEGYDVAQAIDISSETTSLNDGGGDDVAAAAEESVPYREKQVMGVGAKTVMFLSSDDEGSVEADDMAAKDSDENNDAQEGEENVMKEKKRAGRKRKRTIYCSEEGEEKNWEGANVEEGGFSSGCVRKREMPRNIKSLNEDYISDLEEDVKKKKGKRGRKKKVMIEVSDENDEAEQEEEDVKTEKKKPGRKRKVSYSSEENDEDEQEGENGKKVKNDENELISEKNLESDVLSDDNKGYSLRTDRKAKVKSIEQPKQKINKRNPKWIEEESLMCHQCQRNDKGRVVRCTKCKRKRFCIPCLNNWYPHLKEEEVAEACPVCCGNCNCKACLRSCAFIKTETNNNHEFELSKCMLKELLPYLRRLDEEQMVEKEIKAKRQGLSHSKLKVKVADYPKNKRVYCDNCKTSIFDYHRSCTDCSFNTCLLYCC